MMKSLVAIGATGALALTMPTGGRKRGRSPAQNLMQQTQSTEAAADASEDALEFVSSRTRGGMKRGRGGRNAGSRASNRRAGAGAGGASKKAKSKHSRDDRIAPPTGKHIKALTECSGKFCPPPVAVDDAPRNSVVKIWLHTREPDFSEPWKMNEDQKGTCTGFVIAIQNPIMQDGIHVGFRKEHRIMTNAHCVENAIKDQIKFKRPGAENPKLTGEVLYIYQEADLALVRVVEKDVAAFNAGFTGSEDDVIEFTEYVDLETDIVLRGYPDGDNLIKVNGRISRMTTLDYSRHRDYSEGPGDNRELLVIQTQAPVNSGNSGGPGFQKDPRDGKYRCVGVAVASCAGNADNVGFLIPRQVVMHFLEDVKRRSISPEHKMGFPRYGLTFQDTDAKNNRVFHQIPSEGEYAHHGQLINGIVKGSTFDGTLQVGDTIVEVDGHKINNVGMYQPNFDEEGLTEEVHMRWIIAQRFFGDECTIKFFRQGVLHEETVTFRQHYPLIQDLLTDDNGLNRGPAYAITGAVAVTEVTQQYLTDMYDASADDESSGIPDQYVRARALALDAPEGYEEQDRRIVAITGILSEDVEDGVDGHIVTHVNEHQIYNLQHFVDLVADAVKNARPLVDVPKKKGAAVAIESDDEEAESEEEEQEKDSSEEGAMSEEGEVEDAAGSDEELADGDDDEEAASDEQEESAASDESVDSMAQYEDYEFGPQDYAKIVVDPSRVLALGPLQTLARATAAVCSENCIPLKNLADHVDYGEFMAMVKIEDASMEQKTCKTKLGTDVEIDPALKDQLGDLIGQHFTGLLGLGAGGN